MIDDGLSGTFSLIIRFPPSVCRYSLGCWAAQQRWELTLWVASENASMCINEAEQKCKTAFTNDISRSALCVRIAGTPIDGNGLGFALHWSDAASIAKTLVSYEIAHRQSQSAGWWYPWRPACMLVHG